MKNIEVFIKDHNGIQHRLNLSHRDNTMHYGKSNSKWDFKFNITRRDPSCVDYTETAFEQEQKKQLLAFLDNLKNNNKLVKGSHHVRILSTASKKTSKVELFVVE